MAAPRQRTLAQPRARAATVALAAALALAACGGDDETTTSSQAAATTSTSTATGDPPSKLREQLNGLVTELLTDSEGLSPGVARCAIAVLDRRVSDAELEDALAEQARTGESPADLVDLAFEAGRECADHG